MERLRIKELAEDRGFTIASLARRADMSYTTVHVLWNGKAEDVSVKTLSRIAGALGVSIRDLFAEKEQGPMELALMAA